MEISEEKGVSKFPEEGKHRAQLKIGHRKRKKRRFSEKRVSNPKPPPGIPIINQKGKRGETDIRLPDIENVGQWLRGRGDFYNGERGKKGRPA